MKSIELNSARGGGVSAGGRFEVRSLLICLPRDSDDCRAGCDRNVLPARLV